MSPRAQCNALLAALWCFALAGWVAFFYLFRHGGPLHASPTEAKVLWVAILVVLTMIVGWSSRPDETQ